MALPVIGANILSKGTSILSGTIGKIFGGFGRKDYVSAKIDKFGGGGRRTLDHIPAAVMDYHYNLVIKRLGYEGIISPNNSQRSSFWNKWDATLDADWKAFEGKTGSGTFLSSDNTTGLNKMIRNPLLWVGAGLVVLVGMFLIFRRK